MNGIPVAFTRFQSSEQTAAVLNFVKRSAKRVVFTDTAATDFLVETVKELVERGLEVHIRDHHLGEGHAPEAVPALRALLGERATIVTRAEAPGCPMLVELGEFNAPGTVIITDIDLDGLTTAMKAVGITYEGLDTDAEVLDVQPEHSQETLSNMGWLLSQMYRSLPRKKTDRGIHASLLQRDIFDNFVSAASGDEKAMQWIRNQAKLFTRVANNTIRALRKQCTEPAPGIFVVDNRNGVKIDNTMVMQHLARRGATAFAVLHQSGVIAKKHGAQYTLRRIHGLPDPIDLRTLVTTGTPSTPESGVLYNTPFVLHASPVQWEDMILPRLAA